MDIIGQLLANQDRVVATAMIQKQVGCFDQWQHFWSTIELKMSAYLASAKTNAPTSSLLLQALAEEFELEEKHFFGVRYWFASKLSRLNSTFFKAPTP